MDAVIKRTVEAILADVNSMIEAGSDEFTSAHSVLADQRRAVLLELATAAVVDMSRRTRRSNVLDLERAAERLRTAQTHERVKGGDPGHRNSSRRDYWEWVEATDEGKAYEAERSAAAAAVEQECMARFTASFQKALADYTESVRLEWTAELLAADFALPDGTRVTWGEATVEQHKLRAAMFARNAEANMEGAARHLKAIEELERAGVATLGDLSTSRMRESA